MNENVLEVNNLRIYIFTKEKVIKAVDDISFNLKKGETFGLAGESGCGKSMTCLSIVKMIREPARIMEGSVINFEGKNIVKKTEKEMVAIRGKKISMILQEPHMSLNPVYTIGNQIGEAFRLDGLKGKIVKNKSIEMLKNFNILSAEKILKSYPFQCSGGMRQRISAAMSIARSPKILIGDEPTSSLDVTTQKQFFALLNSIKEKNNTAIILVAHDLALVAENCNRVAIMFDGKIVEIGTIQKVFENPIHPYTIELINSIPKIKKNKKELLQLEKKEQSKIFIKNGCCYYGRCKKRIGICKKNHPPSYKIDKDHTVYCWNAKNDNK